MFWWESASELETTDFLLYPHRVEGERDLCEAPFVRTLLLFMMVSPAWLNHLPEAPSPNAFAQGVRISTEEFGGGHKCADSSKGHLT